MRMCCRPTSATERSTQPSQSTGALARAEEEEEEEDEEEEEEEAEDVPGEAPLVADLPLPLSARALTEVRCGDEDDEEARASS